MPGQESSEQLSASGPSILNARAQPSTIELSTKLQPHEPAEVLADVKDFNSNITDVRLRFLHVPLEIPMKNIGGTTWRAILTQKQLQLLAVAGKTMNYEANVIAKNEAGQTSATHSPVNIAVKTPDVVQSYG
jgi:hypothetical protein